MSPMPWVLFSTDVIAPVGDCHFTAWQQSYLGQILPTLAEAMSGVGGAMSQIANLMGDLVSMQCGQRSNAQATCTAASQLKTVSKFFNTETTVPL